MTDFKGLQAPAGIAAFKDVLASVLSSDPGNTTVDLDGCYIAPVIHLLDAVVTGSLSGAALEALKRDVLGMETALAAHAEAGAPASVRPVRVIRSEADLAATAANSLVCPAWDPATVFQAGGDGTWMEPGEGDEFPTAALWEYMTGAYEDIVMDEDREVWVLYDAALPCDRPLRSPDSPDWMSMINNRSERFVTHGSLAEARAALEAECSRSGGAGAALSIRYRSKDDNAYRMFRYYPAGTTVDQLDWKDDPHPRP